MEWVTVFKCGLLLSGSLVLLALAAVLVQVMMITAEIRVIVSRVEMVTNVRNWMVALSKIKGLKQWYEKFGN
ncbi:hypothetical protein EB093_07680 [bacterium]|nr:hypothetical protein [bacterium]